MTFSDLLSTSLFTELAKATTSPETFPPNEDFSSSGSFFATFSAKNSMIKECSPSAVLNRVVTSSDRLSKSDWINMKMWRACDFMKAVHKMHPIILGGTAGGPSLTHSATLAQRKRSQFFQACFTCIKKRVLDSTALEESPVLFAVLVYARRSDSFPITSFKWPLSLCMIMKDFSSPPPPEDGA